MPYNLVMNLSCCEMCPNRCRIDRNKEIGWCGEGIVPRIARVALHYWEEPVLSGKNGSGTIFFSGCPMRCVYCQNYEISRMGKGKAYTEDMLIEAIKGLESSGAHNINFVSPTHFAHVVKSVLKRYTPTVPVVYNTGGYERIEILIELDGLIDVYLPDLKYIDSALSEKYSGRANYFEYAQKAIAEMVKQRGAPKIVNGIMQRGVIVRHLVLPGCTSDSVKIMEYLAKEYGDDIYISAMSQYTPYCEANKYPEINRKLKKIEYSRIVAKLNSLNITQCFIQDSASSNEAYILPFED